jgi:hypothetical protein
MRMNKLLASQRKRRIELANVEFRAFKQSDKDLICALRKIADEIPDPQARIHISLAQQHNKRIESILSDVEENESIQLLISSDTALSWQVQVVFPSLQNASIVVLREAGSDKVTVNINNDAEQLPSIKLMSAAHKHLKAYERTESLDKLLGDELAEFYRKREEGVVRLEALNQKLTEQNEEYRRTLDAEKLQNQSELDAEFQKKEQSLIDNFDKKLSELEEREQKLSQRQSELDDRDSKHARRQIRNDLKKALEARSKEFTLTKSTTRKRLPIHALFILLILAAGAFLVQLFLKTNILSNEFSWWPTIKLSFSAFTLIASIIFYIKWNDSWFRKHADEEFLLKRLELDIDRASWVVEMALEWKEEQGRELPPQLIERLTENLFVSQSPTDKTNHPSEDLTSALISASSGMSVKIPGVGEIAIDRKGIDKFKRNLVEKEKNG